MTTATRALIVIGVVFLPGTAWAQSATTGAIAGEVRDATGAILPGVTVEASSPALIEKTRSVITDDQGRYQIVELRPGRYEVTFTLTGFTTVRREGLELNTGVTLPVNAELRVGSIEETVTVSGASPVVDVQNVRTQNVLNREELDALPTGKSIPGYSALTLGAINSAGHDVGGVKGESTIFFVVHGSRGTDQKLLWDGMSYNSAMGTTGGNNRIFMINQAIAQEIVLETSGMSAEAETAGIQLNVVPKDGGDMFSGTFLTNYTHSGLQSDNLTDELRARGLTQAPEVKRIYDLGGGLGGPIARGKLWFYTAHRWWSSEEYVTGVYYNKTQGTPFYTPDLDRRGYASRPNTDHTVRLTWQPAVKHKFTFHESVQDSCNCFMTIQNNRTPESANHVKYWPVTLTQGTWHYPVTNRLLLQVGGTYGHNRLSSNRTEGVAAGDVPITELSTGLQYGSQPGLGLATYGYLLGHQVNDRVAVSYISGSHALRAGTTYYGGFSENLATQSDPPIQYLLRNGVPVSVGLYAAPNFWKLRSHALAFFAQDQWTVKRLTLNLGARMDYFHATSPAQTRPAGPFVSEIRFEKEDNLVNWKDISPRLGIAYDLFGNGKTAIKGSLGRYVQAEQSMLPRFVMPSNSIVLTATRTWNDIDGDYVPQESELGPLSDTAFGTVRVNTRYDDEVTKGWSTRPSTWQGSAVLQHELRPGFGVLVGYYRTSYGNFQVTDNLLLSPGDFDPYCISGPRNAELPGGGGSQLCGFYDINPAAFGRVDNRVVKASHFGKQSEVFDGIDVSVNARLGSKGGLFAGGLSWGQVVTDNCFVVDTPQLVNCRLTNPPQVSGLSTGGTQVKLQAIYPLPWELQVSAVFQNLQGFPLVADYVATNAEIAPSLGRNLGQCGTRPVCTGTVTLPLMVPGTRFEDRLNQLDLSLKRTFHVGKLRVHGNVDAFNVFNTINVRNQVGTCGANWRRPTDVMLGRLIKFGAQLDF